MPSPLGHALGGLAAGLLVAGPRAAVKGRPLVLAFTFAAAATAPDLDLLIGAHRGPSHSVGAACLAAAAAFLVTRDARLALAVAAAWATHPLLDAMGRDTTPPLGSMALWPFTRDYYLFPIQLFGAISRRYWLLDAWILNARAIGLELIVLGPPAALAWRRASEPLEPLEPLEPPEPL